MVKTSDYQPVSCDIHSQLELSIIHKTKLHIQYVQNDETINAMVIPLDIVSRKDDGEYLLASNEFLKTLEIRLDKLLGFDEL